MTINKDPFRVPQPKFVQLRLFEDEMQIRYGDGKNWSEWQPHESEFDDGGLSEMEEYEPEDE